MFDRPEDTKLYDQIDGRRQSWFRRLRHAQVGLIGGGTECLVAGRVLEQEDVKTVVLTTAESPGYRLLEGTGPVPIFSPAADRLEEWDFPMEENPPVWPDRSVLQSFLVHSYLQEGGSFFRNVTFQKQNVDSEDVQITVSLNDRLETLTFEDVILATDEYDIETEDLDTSDPLEYEVLATRRRTDGAVQAGPMVLPAHLAETAMPLVSAHLLSGRKAAEIVLSQLE